MQSEFDLIARFFSEQKIKHAEVFKGIGDDAAVLTPLPDKQMCIATDTLIAGRHFPKFTSAYDLAYKALAVNLSDLAAMGATPQYFTLSLSLPEYDKNWLEGFSRGLFQLAQEQFIQLIGGDTTRGHLTVTCQVIGYLPTNEGLYRSGVSMGDSIFVSGTLGDARLGLDEFTQPKSWETCSFAEKRLLRPKPRVRIGKELVEMGVRSAIDISDGLIGDLRHMLTASQVPGAVIELERLPCSAYLRATLNEQQCWEYMLAGGDDYELCFTVPQKLHANIEKALTSLGCHYIGEVSDVEGIQCVNREGKVWQHSHLSSYSHF